MVEFFEKRTADTQWKDLVVRVIDQGERKHTTRHGRSDKFTLSGQTLAFDLRNGLPFVTEARLIKGSIRAIDVEMMWIYRGQTDLKFLHDHGVHVWDVWGGKEELMKLGLSEGNLGRIYGQQWRNHGATIHWRKRSDGNKYLFWRSDGVDQLKRLVLGLQRDPDSTANVLTAWHPRDMFDDDLKHRVPVVTCHGNFISMSHANGNLDMSVTCRSSDILIGLKFNIVEYARTLQWLAMMAGLKARKLTMFLCDPHIYENQLLAVVEEGSSKKKIDLLLERESLPFPIGNIREGANIFNPNIDDYVFDYEAYKEGSHQSIAFPVSK